MLEIDKNDSDVEVEEKLEKHAEDFKKQLEGYKQNEQFLIILLRESLKNIHQISYKLKIPYKRTIKIIQEVVGDDILVMEQILKLPCDCGCKERE